MRSQGVNELESTENQAIVKRSPLANEYWHFALSR